MMQQWKVLILNVNIVTLGYLCSKLNIIGKTTFSSQVFSISETHHPSYVSVATKLLYYRLCVHSILLYGSQIWYPSISRRRQLELINRKCLYRVTGLWDYNLQLSQTHTLSISFLSFPLRLNFPKRDYQWEIRPQHSQCHMFQFVVRNLRTSHSQLLTPVLKCNKSTFRQSYFQRVCQWSNFLSEKNRHYSILRKFQVCKRLS